ncbi:MAG: Lysine-sensitive aspartokinase 3 [Owenweeksia sp. TMED14]|nr:MAG: Lysine-sensitive aspartokinase 3 [Owenweeksia sp. TMED14]
MTNWSVFKFGGNSLKDSKSLNKALDIVSDCGKSPLLIVVSAMSKTTNSLEEYLQAKVIGDSVLANRILEKIKSFHFHLADSLNLTDETLKLGLSGEWDRIEKASSDLPFDRHYDEVISAGEIVSSIILHAAIQTRYPTASWLDARMVVRTNSNHRRADINLIDTEKNIHEKLISQSGVWITQGFIASSSDNGQCTTLGREGSDYSAAIFASVLGANELTIWKDVPGLMSGDPKVFNDVKLLEEVPYEEAMELAFYGASVIHPKTIQPLYQRNITLYIRSFLDRNLKETRVSNYKSLKPMVPCLIRKLDQVMLSIRTNDLSLMTEGQFSDVHNTFSNIGLVVNLVQRVAARIVFIVSNHHIVLPLALEQLSDYNVKVEKDLVLYTVKYSDENSRKWLAQKGIFKMEQRTESVYQILLKE